MRYLKAAGILALGLVAATWFVVITMDPGDNVELANVHVEEHQSGDRYLTGAVRNRAGSPYYRVELEVTLLDARGGVVESIAAATRDLGAGQTWNFEVPIETEEAVRFRVENLVCTPTADAADWEIRRTCSAPPFEGVIS